MFYNYVFNNKIIESDSCIYDTIHSTYGLKKQSVNYLILRLEENNNKMIQKLDKPEWELYLNLIYDLVPFRCSLIKRTIFNIYVLDMVTSYRGWRHSRGLPVRGQRTWTNSWSSYKSNWVLRNFKLLSARKSYGNMPLRDIRVASIAEYVNSTWKFQWPLEWVAARNSRLKFKGNKNTIKIDLHAMSNYQVMHPLKLKNLSKKQKSAFKKNYFSLGFEPGFTKPLLMELHNIANLDESNNPQGLSSSFLVLKDERLNKKNAPKKKAELNKKQKVKKKKSVWD